MGVDFFEGPYQDADGIDNPLTDNFSDAVDSLGIPYEGIGIGYGDGVVDNERFGMRRFIYYNWEFWHQRSAYIGISFLQLHARAFGRMASAWPMGETV